MTATYDPRLVALSIVVAVFASYTALDLASRVAAATGRAASYWLAGGAFSMGIGIWSMHFIGMLAFHLPIPLAYDPVITFVSMLPAIAASGFALFIIRRGSRDWRTLAASGLLMGIGIVAMHYTGMAAMRMQPPIRYDPALFALSVLIAVGASTAALRIALLFHAADLRAKVVLQKTGSAVVMGLAIIGMHYTGMAAAHFAPGSVCLATSYGVAPGWLAVLVGAGTLVILSVTLLVSVFDARLTLQAQAMLADLRAVNERLRAAIAERERAESKRQETQTFLASIVDNIPNMVFVKDARELRFVHFNRAGEQLTGYSQEQRIGKNVYDFFPKDQADFFTAKDRETLRRGGHVFIEEEPITTRYGTTKILQTKKLAIPDEHGRPKYLLGISEDITERKRAEEQLRTAARVFDNTVDSVIVYDAERRIVSVNKAFTAVTGYEPQEVIGRSYDFLKSAAHDDAFHSELARVLEESGRWQGEMVRRRKNGELFPALTSVSEVRDEAGVIKNYVTVFNDISSFKQYEAKLQFLAHHDALTRLPNRALFEERFQAALLRARRRKTLVAVLFIDLDRFKTINDSLGHHGGDELLQGVAGRLSGCVRETDVVARLGGDEFTVLIDELTDSQSAGAIAEKVLRTLAEPLEVGGHEIAISGSIGISCYPQDGEDVRTLLKNADVAMYKAKEAGRNIYRFFSADMNERALETLVMANNLRSALRQGEFLLHFQPRCELATGRFTGVEALVRWQHPELGLVPPGKFIRLAEETGLIVPIGEWVLRAACEQLKSWQSFAAGDLRLAVNLSPRQLRQADLAQRIGSMLRETGLEARFLELEITEGMVMQDPAAAVKILQNLKAMGIAISIDDFGTGHSSLSYLKHFAIDFLKIDQSFVRNLEENSEDLAIVTAIIALSKGLGLTVIAEGVETEAQRKLLHLLGCQEAQGYFFSKPQAAQDIEKILHIVRTTA